uniref:Ovule protein n=1 Tax=Heterorhabditis bacteriophora TaxID=37862 RepID=A0A1I7WH64_HETBA
MQYSREVLCYKFPMSPFSLTALRCRLVFQSLWHNSVPSDYAVILGSCQFLLFLLTTRPTHLPRRLCFIQYISVILLK